MRRLLIALLSISLAGTFAVATPLTPAIAADPASALTLPLTGTDVPELGDIFDAMDVCFDFPNSIGCAAFMPFIELIVKCAADPSLSICTQATASKTPAVVVADPCSGAGATTNETCKGAVIIDRSPGSFCYKNPTDASCNVSGTTAITGDAACAVNAFQDGCKDAAIKIDGDVVKVPTEGKVSVADTIKKYLDKNGIVLEPKSVTDAYGNELTNREGQIIYRTIIITSTGVPVTDANGNAIYSELAKDDSGKTLLTKTTKKSASAPVLIFNVLSADDKLILGPDGKPLSTKPALTSDGYAQVDRDSNAILLSPILNSKGQPIIGVDGNPLYTKLMVTSDEEPLLDANGKGVIAKPLLNSNDKPITASNGAILYAPPMYDPNGKPIVDAKGNPVLAKPVVDASNKVKLGADGFPQVSQPLLSGSGTAILQAGKQVAVGAAGTSPINSSGEVIGKASGALLSYGFGGTVIDEKARNIVTPDGRPLILSASGTPLLTNGTPITDKKGAPIKISKSGAVLDSTGKAILGADGKALTIGSTQGTGAVKIGTLTLLGPNNKPVLLGLNGALFDSSANALVSAAGKPLFLDPKAKKVVDAAGKAVAIDKKGKIAAKSQSLKVETTSITS